MRTYLQPPVSGPVSSPFGASRSYGGHVGIDYAVPTGTPVRSAAGGRVTNAGWISNAAGLGVKVDHGGGVSTSYFHLSRATVQAGQFVSAGEVLGLSGATGNASGPHLHFEVRKDGMAINPATALQSGVEAAGAPDVILSPGPGDRTDLTPLYIGIGLALLALLLW